MRKECVRTAITNTEGLRNLGIALTRNFMLVVCVRTVTLTDIIRRKDKCYTPNRIRTVKLN